MLERIFNLIESSGFSDAAFCRELSLGNGIVGKWRTGKQKPSLDAVIKIAAYFHVSIDYLVSGTDYPDNSLTKEDYDWLHLIHQLPEKKQIEFRGELIGYLKALKDMNFTKQ